MERQGERTITAEVAADRLAELGPAPATPEAAPASRTERAYLEAAAVLVSFDPAAVRPVDAAPDPDAKAALLRVCEPGYGPTGRQEWHLPERLRRETLAGLGTPDAFARALEANAHCAHGAVQDALSWYLTGAQAPLEAHSLRELFATAHVLDLLGDLAPRLAPGLPSKERLQERIDREQLLDPMRRLVGDCFRGRADVLARLADYVGVLPPSTPGEAIRRHLRQTRRVLSFAERPPLLIWGPGGVGKSTVLSKFVLSHVEGGGHDSGPRLPFAYIDCDRPGMTPREPLALLGEALRQLGVQFPEVAAEAAELRASWVARAGAADLSALGTAVRETQTSGRAPGDPAGSVRLNTGPAEREAFYAAFAAVARRAAPDLPLLFALDTFETAQRYGPEVVADVWRFFEGLQAALPSLRLVVAGRAPVEQRAETLLLPDFDAEAARGYLAALLGPELAADRGLVDDVARLAGGNPLTLRLAADIVHRHGIDDIRQAGRRHRLFAKISSEERQGYLYQRVLSHIPDPDVRTLARWGLVLRRLTPGVIRHVLAGPCGVDVPDDARADELFAACTREVSLVTVTPDGALQHRSDVRRRLLPLLALDSPDEVRAIHASAIAYYSSLEDLADRAEELYHRLCLGEEADVLGERWQPGVEPLLAGSLEELPPGSQVYLAARSGVTLPQSVLSQVTPQEWERHAEVQMSRLIELGRFTEAIEVFDHRPAGPVSSALLVLEAKAREGAGELAGARQAVGRAARRSTGEGNLQGVLEMTHAHARLAARAGDLEGARTMLAEAAELAEGLRDRVMQIRIVLAEFEIDRRGEAPTSVGSSRTVIGGAGGAGSAGTGGGGTGDAERRLFGLLDEVPAARLAQEPNLLVELAAVVGAKRPELVWEALRTAGLSSLDGTQRARLAEAFSEWDRGSGGAVRDEARHRTGAGTAEPGSSREFWTRWFADVGPRQASAVIGELRAAFPRGSQTAASALASVYRQWLDAATRPGRPGAAADPRNALGGTGPAGRGRQKT